MRQALARAPGSATHDFLGSATQPNQLMHRPRGPNIYARTTTAQRVAMPASKRTRLTISWTKETDLDLRTYLGDQGMKKGDLSKFIEDAVRWHLFNQTVTTIKARNATSDPRSLMQMIDATVRDVRRERASYREALSTLD
jgi:hypothetical protein